MGSCEQKNSLIMKSNRLVFLSFLVLISIVGFNARRKSPFTFRENTQGVELLENGRPVFFYQREPRSLTNQYVYNNYLHPLYSLTGDTLTEEFPEDHPHHRGIFWAWHQLYIGNQSVGDGWVMESIHQEVADVKSGIQKNSARLDLNVRWKSKLWQNGKPFVHEHTTIEVHLLQSDIRIIDFEIALVALVPGVSIGGSDDEKGYGGFCTRIRLPDDMEFTSAGGKVIPQTLQIVAGSWMDFSASFGKSGKKSGLIILCHPSTPNYPAPWILRQVTSTQNIVFPGRQRVNLSMDKPVVLRYRLVLHKGSALDVNIAQLKEQYDKI
ncbi:MAG TPA: hypothetical protein DF818_14390 [Bacteroidales bacterium]|nr:hypothetical protein [Bacteroidales bacterium]